jgi:hypothetical protein
MSMQAKTRLLPVAAAVLTLAACGGTSSTARTSAAPGPHSSAAAAASLAAASASCELHGGTWTGAACYTPSPAPTATTLPPATPTKVEFVVSGTAPDGIDITYGPAGSNYSGPSSLDGTVTESVPFDGQAEFYHLDAQLQGAGSVKCKIVVTGPNDDPLTVSSGGASGGFNICSAQAAPVNSTGLSWQNEE